MREQEADAAGCVSRGVDHFSWQGSKTNGQPVLGTRIRGRDLGGGNPEPTGLHLHRAQQAQIVLVEKYRRPGRFLKQRRSAYVVDMSMGDDNLAQGEAMLLQPGENLRNVVSRDRRRRLRE